MILDLPAALSVLIHFAGDPEPMVMSRMLDGATAFSRIGAEQCLDKTGGPQVCITEIGALIVDDVAMPPLSPAMPALPGPALTVIPQPPAPVIRPLQPLCCDTPHRPVKPREPNPEGPSPVPLPASLPLMLAGLAGLIFVARR